GLGDAELGISVALATTQQWALGLYGQYKFATGDVDDLMGSGQDSLALGARFSAQQCVFARLSCHAQVGLAAVNDSEFDPGAKTWTPFVGLSLAWQLGDSLAVLAQVDAHGVIYDADVLKSNGAPVWGTLGLRWQPVERWLLDAQFVEDLAVGSAPDVIFRFALARSF
ncbi:MAG: DUF3187 family protein, partial [Congregibacter sp.]|nr:DUF3187 family protein [Congregibacter sp.]